MHTSTNILNTSLNSYWQVFEYLYINDGYQSENDPDYVIGETTFDGSNSDDESNEDIEEIGDEKQIDDIRDESANNAAVSECQQTVDADASHCDGDGSDDDAEDDDEVEDREELIVCEEGKTSEKDEEEMFVTRSPDKSKKGWRFFKTNCCLLLNYLLL